MKSIFEEYIEALKDGSPESEATIAEGLAHKHLHVVNFQVVSPGGLRFVSAQELSFLEEEEEESKGAWLLGSKGAWLLGTGFVSRNLDQWPDHYSQSR
jgi:hypothetical protein